MTGRILLFAFLLGVAGGGLAAWAFHAVGASASAPRRLPEPGRAARVETGEAAAPMRAEPAPDPGPTLQGSPRPALSDAAWQADTTQRIERLEERVGELLQQVADLDARTQKTDLGALTEEQLDKRASTLYAYRNYGGALEAYEALLARGGDLDAEKKGPILSAMAQCHRALGEPEKAEGIFKQVEVLYGEGSAGAMTARYQRAWCRHAQDDLEGARDLMRQVASGENTPPFWRLFSRANADDFSIRLGDTASARSDLEAYREELQGDDSDTGRRVLAYVNQLLDSLDE